MMAAIDKIYGTQAQQEVFLAWAVENNKELSKMIIPTELFTHLKPEDQRPLCNLSVEMDIWLWANCQLGFIREELEFQYNGEPH